MKHGIFRKLLVLTVAFVLLTSFFSPQSAEAASAKKQVKKLVANMSTYEYVMLFGMNLSVGEGYEVVLSDMEMATAAAFTAPLDDKHLTAEVGDNGWEYIYSIASSRIKKMTKKMFGKAVSYKKLPKGSWESAKGFLAVYRNSKGKPEFYIWEGETETDFDTIKMTVKKDGKGYKVVKDVYYGYWGWGWNDESERTDANYRITYKVEKNEVSSYGYAITGMTVECIADLTPNEGD